VNQAMTDADDGTTPLYIACYKGHTEVVAMLLAHDAIDVNQATTGEGDTPLYIACRHGHAELVAMLLARDGVDVNQARTDDGNTPLCVACDEGRTDIVTMLLARDEIDANKERIHDGATPLVIACKQGRAAIVEMLLAWDEIDVNKVSKARGPAGGRARAIYGYKTGDYRKYGCTCGCTPLFVACSRGHTEVVRMLLAHDRVDVNQAKIAIYGGPGGTPLYTACGYRRAEIVAMLLASDEIDVNQAATGNHATPISAACARGPTETRTHAQTEIIMMLLARDEIDVNQKTSDGATPLYTACEKGDTDIIRILLADGRADVHVRRTTIHIDSTFTPLHATTGHYIPGRLVAAQLLVVYGASLTAVDRDGKTPAQRATAECKWVLAECLNAVAGWSQLRVAAGCRLYKEAALLLRQGRVDPDDPATTSIQDMMQLVATSKAKPAALPWQNAPPICNATIKLVANATRGWHRTTHWLHHKAVRDAVFAVVLVARRLQTTHAHRAEGSSDALADADTAEVPPIEIWLFAMWFFQRSWWAVEAT
jgi:ankyrin repeat protein